MINKLFVIAKIFNFYEPIKRIVKVNTKPRKSVGPKPPQSTSKILYASKAKVEMQLSNRRDATKHLPRCN